MLVFLDNTVVNINSLLKSIPLAIRLGADVLKVGEVKPCTSIIKALLPSMTGVIQEPEVLSSRLDIRFFDGSSTGFKPEISMLRTPISVVEPKRFFVLLSTL